MTRKKCKYPGCRKMVSNPVDYLEEEKTQCCISHQPLIYTYPKPDECPICCSPFEIELPLFPCYHWICKNCIIHTGKKECPVCRQEIQLELQDQKKVNVVSKRIEREKRMQQLEDDRRVALTLERQLIEEERRHQPRRNVIQIVVTDENMDEIMEILGALAPGERRIYLQALGIEERE